MIPLREECAGPPTEIKKHHVEYGCAGANQFRRWVSIHGKKGYGLFGYLWWYVGATKWSLVYHERFLARFSEVFGPASGHATHVSMSNLKERRRENET